MSRYDGLIIPRSYSEYINKTDAATLQQALQLSGVLSGAVAAGDNKAVKSSAVNNALVTYINENYCKNITAPNTLTREINFPLANTRWFCGEVYGNLNNYGNIVFYVNVQGSDSITKTNIIGDNTKITCTIDTTNNMLIMTCDSLHSFKSVTFIHS